MFTVYKRCNVDINHVFVYNNTIIILFIVKRHLSTKTRNLSNKLDIPLISFRAYHPKEAQMVQDVQVDKILV